MSIYDTYVLTHIQQHQGTILVPVETHLIEKSERELLWFIKTHHKHKQYAFAEIYNRHYEYVWKHIKSSIRDEQEAKDVFSEVWLVALEKIHTVEWQDVSLKYWLRGVTHNKLLEYYRLKKTRNNIQLLDEFHGQAMGYIDQMLEDLETVPPAQITTPIKDCADQLLHKAIQKLKTRDKQIVLFHYYEGLNSTQIGQRLGVKAATIRKAHTRLLPKLKKQLQVLEATTHV